MGKTLSNQNLLIIGSVAFDSIKTPFGEITDALGGSGTYISLAASYFCRPAVVAVVGEDFKTEDEKIFTAKNIDISGLKRQAGKTFRWGGEYSFNLNDRTTLFTELNVFQNFRPTLAENHKAAGYVFLGNIHPNLQLEVLNQIKKPKFAGLDTMNYWIENAPKDLEKVLKLVNVFIINDSEARELSGEHNLTKAARKIIGMMKTTSPRPSPQKERETATLIIKRGEYGLLMFHQGAIFHLPAFPLEDVMDPTGAGDSFAGGFMGFLAKTDDLSFENLKRACVYGSVMASFCVEKLATERLQNLTDGEIAGRYQKFKELTHFELL
jgi:sugar/nucleoside kinase (ribokinase family)